MTGPSAPSAGNWFMRGGWWFLLHLASIGVLLPVPVAHAAVRTRRPGHVVAAAVSLVLVLGSFVLVGVAERAPDGRTVGVAGTLGGLGILASLIGGLVALIVIRPQVFPRADRTPAGRPAPSGGSADPAVAAALAARDRRTEARRLAAQDPLLARELRIGRPDLPRTYDDGGLVDLNHAPVPVIAHHCGLPPEIAQRIVAARGAAGRFTTVDDVFAWADLPYETWELVRDRGVVLAH